MASALLRVPRWGWQVPPSLPSMQGAHRQGQVPQVVPGAPRAGAGLQALGSTGEGLGPTAELAARPSGMGPGPHSRAACHALTRVCCAPAVPSDQTPAADARLSPAAERCAGPALPPGATGAEVPPSADGVHREACGSWVRPSPRFRLRED